MGEKELVDGSSREGTSGLKDKTLSFSPSWQSREV